MEFEQDDLHHYYAPLSFFVCILNFAWTVKLHHLVISTGHELFLDKQTLQNERNVFAVCQIRFRTHLKYVGNRHLPMLLQDKHIRFQDSERPD